MIRERLAIRGLKILALLMRRSVSQGLVVAAAVAYGLLPRFAIILLIVATISTSLRLGHFLGRTGSPIPPE